MQTNLVLADSAETISPEGLEVANLYLQDSNIEHIASKLQISPVLVSQQLNNKHVKSYIDTVFMNIGYRNRDRLGAALDTVIDAKIEEMQDTELTSSKDIADLLALAHKMRMEELKFMQASKEAVERPRGNAVEVNIQDNSVGGGNYGALLRQLMDT